MNRYVVFLLTIETITADFFAFREKICLSCIEQVTVGTDERHLSKKLIRSFIFYQILANKMQKIGNNTL